MQTKDQAEHSPKRASCLPSFALRLSRMRRWFFRVGPPWWNTFVGAAFIGIGAGDVSTWEPHQLAGYALIALGGISIAVGLLTALRRHISN
jgi:hypothetical protein